MASGAKPQGLDVPPGAAHPHLKKRIIEWMGLFATSIAFETYDFRRLRTDPAGELLSLDATDPEAVMMRGRDANVAIVAIVFVHVLALAIHCPPSPMTEKGPQKSG